MKENEALPVSEPTLQEQLLSMLDSNYEQSKQRIEIPEWGAPGKPVVLYSYASSPSDYSKAEQLCEAWKMEDDNFALTTALLVIKLLDAKGKRVFQDDALPQLMKKGNVTLFNRIASDIRKGASYEEGIEGAKKPSATDQS